MFDLRFLFLSLALLAVPPDKDPDTVQLKDGRTLTGRVVYEGPDALRIMRGAGELEVKRDEIDQVRTLERSLAEYIERFDKVSKTDSAALAELARFCASRGLQHEARHMWIRSLFLNPKDEAAVEGAGGKTVGGKTKLPGDKKRMLDLDDWRAPKAKWREAIELPTTHFLVRTDLEVDRVLLVLVQIERHYQRFYQFLAPELVLYVFDEVPEIELYGNAKDYPPSWSPGALSWFAPGENKLHVLVDGEPNLKQITHELTEMLLFNAFRRSSGKTGQIPPWAIAGFAEYFAATAGENPGDAWAPLGQPWPQLMRAFASDEKPLPVKQLMRSSVGELNRGNDSARRSAQAYALVHYLMHADDNAHRALFFQMLRQAWKGKSIENDLLKGLGLSEQELQAAVLAHAHANGG